MTPDISSDGWCSSAVKYEPIFTNTHTADENNNMTRFLMFHYPHCINHFRESQRNGRDGGMGRAGSGVGWLADEKTQYGVTAGSTVAEFIRTEQYSIL